jgi:hypothetical protein
LQRDRDSGRACQEFGYETGVKIKILEPKSLPGEIYVVVGDYLTDCITESGLVGIVVGCVQITRILILEVFKIKAKTVFSPNCRKTSGMV